MGLLCSACEDVCGQVSVAVEAIRNRLCCSSKRLSSVDTAVHNTELLTSMHNPNNTIRQHITLAH